MFNTTPVSHTTHLKAMYLEFYELIKWHSTHGSVKNWLLPWKLSQHIRRDHQYTLIVPLFYSTFWHLHVSAVACQHFIFIRFQTYVTILPILHTFSILYIYTTFISLYIILLVAQLVEVLRYKPEGRGINSRYYHWNFSFTYYFRPHYGSGANSVSNRIEYEEYFLVVKAVGPYG
jgi:hypothetical protein